MIIEKNNFEKKISDFFRREKNQYFLQNSSDCNFGEKFQKTHFFKKNDEKNQNFKNSNDRSMKHPMGWVRAKYQLQRSSDGFSKSTPVIFWICVDLHWISEISLVN